MEIEGLYPIQSKSGIKRDGTSFESNYYSDGHWCRFQRGKPRKIGGYRQITSSVDSVVRGTNLESRNGINYLYAGTSNKFDMIPVDNTGSVSSITDRTPAGFTTHANNLWQIHIIYDSVNVSNVVVAHAGQNLTSIDSTVQTPIYYGNSTDATALVSSGTSVSGGAFIMHPYVIGLDNDGYLLWSQPNKVQFTGAGSGNARICGAKLIKGMATRGGTGYSPSGLLWSIDELYRMSYVGGAPVFSFDYVGDTSLLSTSAVVEYNGRHFWPDLNGFKTYAGTMEDMHNDMNVNYFYDNYNKSARQKIWGLKIPRYHEIWWFWPKGTATECTDVLIYNIKENTWYDTSWQSGEGARSCGVYSNKFPYPMMFGLDTNSLGQTALWQHEFGVDKIIGSSSYAIRSYFETANLSYNDSIIGDGFSGIDKWIECLRIEPDFVQSGEMSVVVKGSNYAATDSSDHIYSAPYTFTPSTEKIDMKEQRRQMTLIFESNVAGGDYQLGQTMGTFIMGDSRQ